jgi:hypothetical protein
MNLSNRHHYVPKFLIKNFCDTDEKLWVYDKETGRIGKHKRSPKSVFFENGRNLSTVNGEIADNIERMYGEVDDLLATTVEKVLRTESTMTGRELTLLIFLASLTKWRIPKANEVFDKLADQTAIENLGIAIRPVDKTATMS